MFFYAGNKSTSETETIVDEQKLVSIIIYVLPSLC